MDFITYSIILDDIVFPDGTSAMAVLGGSGPQTAFGMKLWTDSVGLVGGVGHDWPAAAQAWLDAMEIDCAGIRHYADYESLRAWQVTDWDGRRTQVWRTKGQAIPDQLAFRYEFLSPSYRQAKALHYGIHPEQPNLKIAHDLHRANPAMVIAIEPFKDVDAPLSEAEVRALLSAGQIFSPNVREAEMLVGKCDPLELVRRLGAMGAEIVTLRMGGEGSLVYRHDTGEAWQIPVVPVKLVDPTGAGNAYGGGFIVGWVLTGDLKTAGLYASVAASFLVEQVGLPTPPLAPHRHAARQRLAEIEPKAEQINAA